MKFLAKRIMFERFKTLIRYFIGSYKIALYKGMRVGKGITVMGGVNFGSEPYLITLDDYVRISNNVSFITHDGGNWSFRHIKGFEDVNHFGKIHVGEHSFIGANATIMPGVRIGKNCCIGVGALVTKNIPDNSVAVGIPARVVSTTYEYANRMKSRMPSGWNVGQYKNNKKNYLLNVIKDPEE